jgi:hypothetical protein
MEEDQLSSERDVHLSFILKNSAVIAVSKEVVLHITEN